MRRQIKLLLSIPVLSLFFLIFLSPVVFAAPPHRPLLTPGNPTINPISNTHTAPLTSAVSITYDEPIHIGLHDDNVIGMFVSYLSVGSRDNNDVNMKL